MKTSSNKIKVYDEVYLDSTPDILGQAFDWVSNTCHDDLAVFADRFAKSSVGHLFERGCPKYVAGVNGAELVNEVMLSLHLPQYTEEHVFWLDKSAEYWAGWLLAQYQWYRKEHFSDILARIPIAEFLRLYPLAHEQDEQHVFEILDSIGTATV